MATKDLTTFTYVKNRISSITDASADGLLQSLVTAVSDAIEKYCRRSFYSKDYDEVYSGTGYDTLLLRAYPIQSVQSLRFGPTPVLQVTNSDTTTNQQARVKVTSTGLTLTRVASGST